MSESDGFRELLALTVGGVLISYNAWSRVKRINRVKDSARQLISAASAGQVELEAVAWPIGKFEKCLEGKKCIYLELRLEEYKGTGKNKSWREIWSYRTSAPFLAFDQSGFIKVKPSGEHFIDILRERVYQPHRMLGSQQVAFNALCGDRNIFNRPTFFGFSLGNNFRIKERKILLGSPILIHGFLTPEDKIRFVSPDPVLKDFHSRCTKLLKSPGFKQKFFDKDKDGVVTREELSRGFERVLQMSAGDITDQHQLSSDGERHCRYYGEVSANENEHLHLADTHEEQYLKSKSTLLAWLAFGAGLFVFFLGLYLMARHFGHA